MSFLQYFLSGDSWLPRALATINTLILPGAKLVGMVLQPGVSGWQRIISAGHYGIYCDSRLRAGAEFYISVAIWFARGQVLYATTIPIPRTMFWVEGVYAND